MDSFETPYEDEASIEFIDCAICEKSIRGDTLYKIHLTTQGHIKKEDALVAAGHIVREHPVPIFEDILQYLDYLDLDEPIIGLNYLVEVPGSSSDQPAGLKYTCELCFMTTTLPDIVHHVIGRKHRQKYMELKRPDLVTWDKSLVNQGGKIIRARAEIIERQDGRGTPMVTKKRGKSNMSRAPPRQQQNRARNITQSFTQRDRPTEFKDYRDEYPRPGFSNAPQRFPREDSFMKKEPWREDYSENMYGGQRMDTDSRGQYEDEYAEEPQTDSVNVYDSMPQDQDYYPEEAPPYGKPYPEKDPLKEFYAQEVRNGRVRSAERQTTYPESNKRHWSLDQDPGRVESRSRLHGSGEPEAKRSHFPTPVESNQSHFLIDYQHERGEPYQEGVVSNPGPSRPGPPDYQRPESSSFKPEIPDPFRQFLNGPADAAGQLKRKRKSRFSNATETEVQNATKMFRDEFRPPNPSFGAHSRPGGVPFKPEVHGPQHPDLYTEPQRPHDTNNYQRGGSEAGEVLDMLNNIEIENTEDAEFLKGKLCNLLKEFKAKKSQKNMANSHGHGMIPKDSNSLNSDMSQHHYERNFRDGSDIRESEEFYVQEDHRRRFQEQKADERQQEYTGPVCGDARLSNRSRYEGMYQPSPPPHPDEPTRYPERFQEPSRSRDYRPAAEEFYDSRSAGPPLHMEPGPRMHRNPQYSNSLDKITSTLLELMSRKQS